MTTSYPKINWEDSKCTTCDCGDVFKVMQSPMAVFTVYDGSSDLFVIDVRGRYIVNVTKGTPFELAELINQMLFYKSAIGEIHTAEDIEDVVDGFGEFKR